MIKIYSSFITNYTQADYTRVYSLLECALKEQIDAKLQPQDKMRSLVGYDLLYRGALELYNKNKFDLTFNQNGKPLCDFCYFNISHSHECVVCAFSDQPVGIDIQKITEVKPREKYKFFTEQENYYVNEIKDLVSERYIEIFTKKESAIKMLGLSFANDKKIDTFSNEFKFETEKDNDFIMTVCCQNNENL